jgi:UDP-3-O-[3-hydroxymyristoyl] glucosamine N-acyltransferase
MRIGFISQLERCIDIGSQGVDKMIFDQKNVRVSELVQDIRLNITAVIGMASETVERAAPLNDAGPGCLTFARSFDQVNRLAGKLTGAVVICSAPIESYPVLPPYTLLITDNPRLSFMRAIAKYFGVSQPPAGVDPSALLDPTARIDPTAHIGAFCSIGAGCVIGPGTVIRPHVTIYDNVRIGANCRINSGTVIGADGFGYERNALGELEKFPHIGGVLIGDNVEIGSNTSIDRGSLGDTRIENGSRIDNLVHISHNVRVGEDAAVIALSMLGGSVDVGKGAWIAPGAVIMNQISVGEHATVGLGAVVVKHVASHQTVMGSPAQDSLEFKASRAAVARLVNS